MIGLLLAILLLFMSFAGIANYIAKGKFGAAFKFNEIFQLVKKAFLPWLLVFAGMILALGIIAPLGGIACGMDALLTLAYGTAVYSHLLGQSLIFRTASIESFYSS